MRKVLGHHPLPTTFLFLACLCFTFMVLLQSADVSVMPWLVQDIIDKVRWSLVTAR